MVSKLAGERVLTFDSARTDLEPAGTHAGAFASYRLRPGSSLTLEWGLRYDLATWPDDAAWRPTTRN